MIERFQRILLAALLGLPGALPANANLCPADVDGDGEVSSADLSLMLLSFGPCGPGTPEDLDGDGFVTSADMALAVMQWGACPRDLIEGVLRDRVTLAPIAGATVFFYGTGYGYATTDASGHYLFRTEDINQFGGPLQGHLHFGKTGHFEPPSVLVTDLAQQPSLPVQADATLLASGPLVIGRVTDASTSAGVAGASVVFYRNPMSTWMGGATAGSTSTDSNGDYAIDASYFNESGLVGGFDASIQVSASGFVGSGASASFSTGPVTRNFQLVPTGAPVITGTVTDRTTLLPVAGATVFFYGSGYGTTTTDAAGHYAFTGSDLHPFGGPLYGNLFIGKTGYFEPPAIAVPDLSMQPSLPVNLNATLLPGSPVTIGRVTDASTSAGIAGASVVFNRSPMSSWMGGATSGSTSTDANGDYAIDASYFNESGLTTGFSVNLQVAAAGYLSGGGNASFTVTPWVRNFALPNSAMPLMAGTLVDRVTFAPIAGATVFFYGSGYGSVTTDAAGQWVFHAGDLSLFGGPVQGALYMGKTGYFEALPIQVTDLASQPSLPVIADASLPPGGAIVLGTVTSGISGNPVQGATISFSRNPPSTFLGGATTLTVTTDANGDYVIDSSAFNESGLTSGFSIHMQANGPGYLGSSWGGPFTLWPMLRNFTLN